MHRPRSISVGLLLAIIGLLALGLQAPAMAAERTTRATGQSPADVDPPVITQPQDLAVAAVDASGATVAYRVPRASDAIDGVVPVACAPASGSFFPVGQTVVSCAAQDQAGNQVEVAFGVTVTVEDRPVRTEAAVATETAVATQEPASTPTPDPTQEPEQATATPEPTQEAETPTEAATATATADDQSADPTTSATPDETAAADSATTTPDATQEPTSTPSPSPTEESADGTASATSDSPTEATVTETSTSSSNDSEATETPAATETPVATEPDATSAPADTEATSTPTEAPTQTPSEETDTATPEATGTTTPEATPADESGTAESAAATEPAAAGADSASATPETDAQSVDATATPTTTASPTVTETATASPTATETATPSPTATVPAALELPAVSPDDFVLAVDGGPIDGLAAIWRNQDFPITQEFGHTEFSITHVSWYAYGADYGLDGYEHPGIDIGMPKGTQLYSPVDGTVKIAGGVPFYTFYGNGEPGVGELLIVTDDGDEVILGHMGRIAVSEGERVEAGQFVGLSGGDNGDHLHLETREKAGGGYRIVDPRRSFLIRAIAKAAREADASRSAGERQRS